jgi:large subunit ribosomal protein L24
MNTLHIKKGDTVKIRSGNEKGSTGKITKVFPKTGMVLIEGVGMHKKHQKPRREGQKGQIVDKQFPIHSSKITNTAAKKEKAKEKTKRKK